MGDLVRSDVRDGIATITLDSPRNRNALSNALVAELHAELTGAIADTAVRVIVLTGTGPVFCAGADLKERRDPQAPPPAITYPEVLSLIWTSPTPVICRLNGTARAGGLGLVAACDFAIAPDTANFAFTEVRLGVVPAIIAVTCLRRMEPRAAAEYFLTGETFDAARAEQIGLLTRAVPEADLDAAVEYHAGMLLRGAPKALAITKEMVRTVPGLSLEDGFARMAELSAERFGSAEGREGLASFAEKRDPSWVIRRAEP
jgi:methylglutaconyl-CoA hydratase